MTEYVNFENVTVYGQEAPEDIDNKSIENNAQSPQYQRKKDTSFGDVFVFQMIVCVMIILAIVVLNIADGDNARAVVNSFQEEVDKVFDYKQELKSLVTLIFRFINVEV